jgi:hypothetical protein
MRLNLLIIPIATLLFFTACSSKKTVETKQPIVFSNNTEIDEWSPVSSIKENPNAHSGKYVSVIDATNEYSLGLVKQIKNISNQTLDSVTFSYWVFLKNNDANAVTVISIETAQGKSLFWDGLYLRKKVKEINNWVHVKETFKIPAGTDKNNILKLYVWNKSKEEILLDDFNIEFK